MSVEVRIADALDRQALKEFYSREGMDFQKLASRLTPSASGMAKETMFIVGVTSEIVVAALRLDIGQDPSLGKVGFVQHFEIEDELEKTDLGLKMLEKAIEIAEEKNLRCLDALISEEKADAIKLFKNSMFDEHHREVLLRRDFKTRIF
ncbi:MAG: hypothetical protein KAR33_00115 [Candidatus Thorarchaeota archaeon]|nr:hypothetical protein [Candidatus Thorarchaeota archaeon]